MKKMKAALVGAGNRGCVYSDYSLDCPNELEIVAVVDPNEVHLNFAGDRYSIDKSRRYAQLDDFLKDKVECDFVIDATMDEAHYVTCKKLMLAGYNVQLEKPITSCKQELLELWDIAKSKKIKVAVCHVLRYAPFYKKIKTLINDGVIGEIFSMEFDEHVWMAHYLDSYIRGKWSKESQCGSSFLLAKSCHDMDLICWLNNKTRPKYVSSFGSRAWFVKKNAPEGATEFCYNCPHNESCYYSAQKVHLEYDSMPFQTWLGMGKPIEEITKAEKAEYLKTSNYGRCAYDSGGDITDRQTVNIEFENGSVATFTMVGGSCKGTRFLHIVGSKGEISGTVGEGCFKLELFDRSAGHYNPVTQVIDVNGEIVQSKQVQYGGHAGGDYVIMYELVRYFGGEQPSVSITDLSDSIMSHLICYAAEQSRKTKTVVKLFD